ncbi:sensor histidine kinase [Winogradskya consettensis]|nr:histidine kinase [Actinoplanes consettensis]
MVFRTMLNAFRARFWDLALGSAMTVLFALSGTAVALPLAVAQLLPLFWRRRFPAAALLIVGSATAAHTVLGMARAIGFFPATIALYTAATHGSPRVKWVLCPAVGVAMAAASAVRHGPVEGLLMAIVTVTVAWLAGMERSEHLRQRMERAAAEDRERLARRVHDSLARTVTVMLLQTEALRATTPLDSAAEQRIDTVLGAGRSALAEVREALAAAGSGPALGPRLEMLRGAGLRISGHPPARLPAPLQDITDRLITEAATNALRHDGPGTLLTITTVPGDGTLTVRLTTEPGGSASGSQRAGGGFGLVSLTADIHGYGGELTFGSRHPAGWQLEATFPALVPGHD